MAGVGRYFLVTKKNDRVYFTAFIDTCVQTHDKSIHTYAYLTYNGFSKNGAHLLDDLFLKMSKMINFG